MTDEVVALEKRVAEVETERDHLARRVRAMEIERDRMARCVAELEDAIRKHKTMFRTAVIKARLDQDLWAMLGEED